MPKPLSTEISELQRCAKGMVLQAVEMTKVLTKGDLQTGEGPYLIIVDGDVSCKNATFATKDYIPGLVIIRGNLEAHSARFRNGARVFVTGSIVVQDCIFGEYGDHNAVLQANGAVTARAILLQNSAAVYASKGVTAAIYARAGTYRFDADIANDGGGKGSEHFVDNVLDRYGDLDFDLAHTAICAGRDIFQPGALQEFPKRSRKT